MTLKMEPCFSRLVGSNKDQSKHQIKFKRSWKKKNLEGKTY